MSEKPFGREEVYRATKARDDYLFYLGEVSGYEYALRFFQDMSYQVK